MARGPACTTGIPPVPFASSSASFPLFWSRQRENRINEERTYLLSRPRDDASPAKDVPALGHGRVRPSFQAQRALALAVLIIHWRLLAVDCCCCVSRGEGKGTGGEVERGSRGRCGGENRRGGLRIEWGGGAKGDGREGAGRGEEALKEGEKEEEAEDRVRRFRELLLTFSQWQGRDLHLCHRSDGQAQPKAELTELERRGWGEDERSGCRRGACQSGETSQIGGTKQG